MIFILKGKIDIYTHNNEGEEVFLYELTPGEYCHQSIYCHMKNKNLDIIGYCVESTKVAILPNGLIKEFLISNTIFLSSVYQDIYEKMNIMIQEKRDILTLSIEERIIKYLKNSNTDAIKITHGQLANYINTSREVVSRNLKNLSKKGLIENKLGRIILTSEFKKIKK